jgi:lysophospholipase L1-like esterase
LLLVLGAVIPNDIRAQDVTPAYTADTSGQCVYSANNNGYNIGHSFYVSATNVQVISLGVADCGGDGLASSHTVTLFSYDGSNFDPIPGGSVTVPAGTNAPLIGGYRYQALPAPFYLPIGFYAVIAYQMDTVTNGDPYIADDGNNGFNGSGAISDHQNYFANVSDASPSFPGGLESGQNFGSASFTYVISNVPITAGPGVPTITPSAVLAKVGQTISLTASDSGTPPLNFQWYYGNTSTPIAGATNATLTLTNLLLAPGPGNGGTYYVSAQNAEGGPVFNTNGSQVLVVTNAILPQAGTTAFTADPYGSLGSPSKIVGLNIGHLFNVSGVNINVFSLGVYDYWADGLNAAHTVSLFANTNSFFGSYTPVPGGTVTVPAGTNAMYTNGYRYVSLPVPVTLTPGEYAVVSYQMDSGANSDNFNNDLGDNGFIGYSGSANGGAAVTFDGSVYDNTTDPGPTFPSPAGTGGLTEAAGVNWGCASFTYTVPAYVPTITPPVVFTTPGQTVTLTAAANGTPPISYQWYYGNSVITPIPGATNATLVLTNVQAIHSAGNIGNYAVTAQNAYGDPVFSANPYQASVSVIPSQTPLKIMPLGDSITYGSEPAAYRADLYQLLLGAYYNISYVGNETDNSVSWLPSPYQEGHSGYRIDQIYDGFLTWINTIPSPDIILLLIGTNDYGQNIANAEADATNHLDLLITRITTSRPNAKLFVSNLTLRADPGNPAIEAAIEATYNPYVPIIVSNHAALGQQVYFVNMHPALGTNDLLTKDFLHPNLSGYTKMAAVWFNAITNVIPPPGTTNATVCTTTTNTAINYLGIPGFEYVTQRSTNLGDGTWVSISTNILTTNGLLQVLDGFNDLGGNPPQAAFYKLLMQ